MARAIHESHIIPGKFHNGYKTAYVAWGGKEHAVSEYYILLKSDGIEWIPIKSEILPDGAIPIGYEGDVPLYSVKGKVYWVDALGKYHSKYKKCYFPYGGKEVEVDPTKCEILALN